MISKGQKWRHKQNHTIYTVTDIANDRAADVLKFPSIVIYKDADSGVWARLKVVFLDKFERVL